MTNSKHIGIIGGTGTIGAVIVEQLARLKACPPLLIGSRKVQEEIPAGRSGNNGRFEYCRVDYRNDAELADFCSRCLLVINAAGPSFEIRDKIALEALKNHCHYMDIGGYDLLPELLESYREKIENRNLCFVTGAGWMPGISGVFSKAVIETHMDNPEKTEFTIYYGAVDNWSYASTYDLVASSMGEVRSYAYSYGERKAVSPFRHTHTVLFPFIGHKKICMPLFGTELTRQALSLKQIRSLSAFVMINDYVSMGKFMSLKLFYRNRLDRAIRMLQKDYRRLVKKENKWGSVVCRVSEAGRDVDRYYYLYTHTNLLWTALPAVLATRYILEGKVKSGLNCLCDAVDCRSFMSDLNAYGIKYRCYEQKK